MGKDRVVRSQLLDVRLQLLLPSPPEACRGLVSLLWWGLMNAGGCGVHLFSAGVDVCYCEQG